MVNKKEYPVDMSFVDRQGNTIHPSRENYNNLTKNKTGGIGEAYAFFNCKASKYEIEKELPNLRDIAQIPNKLELSLTEGINPKNFKHKELKSIAQNAKKAGIGYFMKANYKNASNKQTADEVSSILNQAYQSPLYKENEQFNGGIFYEENGHYIERE